ncbi:MAG: SUMF1/EgtB/PvdO family nonheme iron enzyme [Muribaculaceae bacterium]|nr:SUMF1/EgtB/PvdO family nonheme iron enzyme [Muribaculaceae bacterium]
MKRIHIILLFLTTIFCLQAQKISVESFELLPHDLTANIEGSSRFDPNTRKNAALIKIETTQKGFVFEGGSLGFVGDPEYKTGEIWLYVPEGAKKLTLKHATLGVLREHYYNTPIQSGKTYLMKLSAGKVITHVEEDLGRHYLTLMVTPKNADVYIDGNMQIVDAEGVVTVSLPYGTHQYQVSANMYKTEVGNITISSEGAVEKEVSLEPDYSVLHINSNPEGATVYIDNVNAGTTPVTTKPIISGEHTFQFRLPMYNVKTVKHNVQSGGGTQTITETLQPNFSTVTITVPNQAEIYINNEKKGVGTWSGKLNAGDYIVEARKESHHATKISVTATAGEVISKTLEAPVPRYGILDLQTTPARATIYIDGKEMGISPNILKNILIGERTITLKKDGYETMTKIITIEEGKASSEKFSLTKKTEQQPMVVTQPKENKATTVNGYTETIIKGLNRQMVYVEGGTFTMGATPEQGSDVDDDEKPAHKVTLSSYYIGRYEVTQAQWRAIMGENPSKFTDYNNPVEQVSWSEAQEFCKKLSTLTGKKYRLPTEAEWEYAARGGKKSKGYKYSGSNNIEDVAWYKSNSGSKTHPVGQKQPNELGIYDMSGNVSEWCYDLYDSYTSSPQTNPTGPTSGSIHVNRGGSWYDGARYCRVAYRCNHSVFPGNRRNYLGLRLVCEIENNEAKNVSTNNKVNTPNAHEYVDLGLSVKWATCNVGANTPEEYGDYFAWGETTTKSPYSDTNYKYSLNPSTLPLSADAAHVNWGGKWRMPTKAEYDELMSITNCTWIWTTQKGVSGYKVTSNVNGNTIFLPAAGFRDNGDLYDAGSHGYYWLSSLYTGISCYACSVFFNSVNVDWDGNDRCNGQSVRAVCE